MAAFDRRRHERYAKADCGDRVTSLVPRPSEQVVSFAVEHEWDRFNARVVDGDHAMEWKGLDDLRDHVVDHRLKLAEIGCDADDEPQGYAGSAISARSQPLRVDLTSNVDVGLCAVSRQRRAVLREHRTLPSAI